MTILSTLEGVVVFYVVFVMNTFYSTLCSRSLLLVSHELMINLAEMTGVDFSGMGWGEWLMVQSVSMVIEASA